jgi:uncharacterized membrane protein HdeD (DUF308 family)
MAGFSSTLSQAIKKPMVRRFSGALIIILGVWALLTPVKSLVSDRQYLHQSIQFPQPTDLDYLV